MKVFEKNKKIIEIFKFNAINTYFYMLILIDMYFFLIILENKYYVLKFND